MVMIVVVERHGVIVARVRPWSSALPDGFHVASGGGPAVQREDCTGQPAGAQELPGQQINAVVHPEEDPAADDMFEEHLRDGRCLPAHPLTAGGSGHRPGHAQRVLPDQEVQAERDR